MPEGAAVVDVEVPMERLTVGELPRVCVVTGRPAIGTIPMRFSSVPTWLFGFGALAAMFTRKDLEGLVPVAEGVVERHVARRRLVAMMCLILALAIGAAAVGGVMLLPSDVVDAWLNAFLIGCGVLGLVVGSLLDRAFTFVDARPRRGTGQVTLRGVHPNFAAALAAEPAETIDSFGAATDA